MPMFRVSGEAFRKDNFSIEVEGASEDEAMEQIYGELEQLLGYEPDYYSLDLVLEIE